MSCIDVVFAAVLIVTLTWTWKKYTFQGDTNHWVSFRPPNSRFEAPVSAKDPDA